MMTHRTGKFLGVPYEVARRLGLRR
jgi:hypothetical protein